MIAAVALECADLAEATSEPIDFLDCCVDDLDPLARLIAGIDRQIERRDEGLDEPFVLHVSRRAAVPLALCGTRTRVACDGVHAGQCRAVCDGRSREWRAELDAEASGPDGRAGYELVYRVRWTSDWYRDRAPAVLHECGTRGAGARRFAMRIART